MNGQNSGRLYEDISTAPLGSVKDDLTIGTAREILSGRAISIIALHLAEKGYHRDDVTVTEHIFQSLRECGRFDENGVFHISKERLETLERAYKEVQYGQTK